MDMPVLTSAVLAAVMKPEQLPTRELLFSPFKLICLVAWFYACLYFVQAIELSSLVSKQHKSLVNFAALFLGPAIFAILVIRETFGKGQQKAVGFAGKLRLLFDKATGNLKNIGLTGARGKSSIILLDSSGKSLAELYSQKGDKHQVRNTLKLTEQIILDAIKERASDILIDPKDNASYVIRFRIDGVLRQMDEVDAKACMSIVNSVKAVAGMDISEKRRPQDGAFVAHRPEGNISFRVASAGVLNGEKLAIRVLNQETGMLSLTDVGVNEEQYTLIDKAVARPSGMILICGPTGSGKTTTLYAMLTCIDFFKRNVITVEDPIEYILPNASQIEINEKAGITFAKALRSILRQDPDVICAGEIRDEETAAMALQSAQTGHLVIATLHSNSNISSLVRLLDLGVKPLLLSSALSMIVSQRLVRTLCEKCKSNIAATTAQMEFFAKNNIDPAKVFVANGCKFCGSTGYRGRTGIFDVLEMNDELRANIANGTFSVMELKKEAEKRGMGSLRKEGIKKVLAGITTMEEVKRVTTDAGV
jgi:type II secretory ATPase GspE/PulE/Tfp pilus assembly ATPase PilB-like protein